MHCEQLPPTTEKAYLSAPRKPFVDFPSTVQEKLGNRRFNPDSAVPTSQSESGLHDKEFLQVLLFNFPCSSWVYDKKSVKSKKT